MKRKKLMVGALVVTMLGVSGCAADKKTVIQNALADQWRIATNTEVQKLFCNTTASGYTRNANWIVYWSSDCRTGKLEVGPSGEYKTAYRTVEIKGNDACITNVGEEEKCYSYLEKNGIYKYVRPDGTSKEYNIKKGIPEAMQKELDAFSSK